MGSLQEANCLGGSSTPLRPAFSVMEVVAKKNKVTILDHDAGRAIEKVVEGPMVIPRNISEGWKPQLIQDLPAAFCGGWVGFFSYETVCYVEKKKFSFSHKIEKLIQRHSEDCKRTTDKFWW